MATAKTILNPNPVVGVTLTLTTLEAAALLAVFRNVGGSALRSARGQVDDVRKALMNALPGIDSDIAESRDSLYSGDVYFKEGSVEALTRIIKQG